MGFTKDYLDRLIADQVEESSILEYKAAASLERSPQKKQDITKDISALANAGGGLLIYGIREHTDPDRKHLPVALDPVDQSQFSKEWLDQIIGLIQPRIDGLRIIPVHVGPSISDYCYVVEISQSSTAHQALDRRYYKRRNFESTPMEDYEIRDVMNRRKHPVLTAAVRVISASFRESRIAVRVENISRVMARYFCAVVQMPLRLSSGALIQPDDACLENKDGLSFWLFSFANRITRPLFPGSTIILQKKLSHFQSLTPDPGPSIPEIRLTLFADEMEKITLTKTLNEAERDWT